MFVLTVKMFSKLIASVTYKIHMYVCMYACIIIKFLFYNNYYHFVVSAFITLRNSLFICFKQFYIKD